MAIFRPEETKSSGVSNFYGFTPIAILGFEDKSDQFDWADLFLDVEVKQEGSDYQKSLRIAGNLEKDINGKITGGTALKRVYGFFDVIGERAGLNVDGNWEDADGKKITNIATHLNQAHSQNVMPGGDLEFNFLAYVYKEKPKTTGAKVYSRVFYRIQPNTDEGRQKLEADVKWFKSKGFIKEATEADINTPQQSVEMSASGVGNL
jgi:hypothetical protein|tara:strand:- start:16585 stop:17202 length:618 start_codon:yes stop_codon:yes gene_type:complete